MVSSKEYLFVYGTLMRASGNAGHLVLAKHAIFAGKGEFRGKLYMIAEYPGVVPSSNPNDRVEGELYLLEDPEAAFTVLDEYEGYYSDNPDESLYTRAVKEIIVKSDGRSVNSWIYIYNHPVQNLTQILSGNFLEFIYKE